MEFQSNQIYLRMQQIVAQRLAKCINRNTNNVFGEVQRLPIFIYDFFFGNLNVIPITAWLENDSI